MKECKNCGNMVTNRFARVYGDNQNNIKRCLNCLGNGEESKKFLRYGGGAIEDEEVMAERMQTSNGI